MVYLAPARGNWLRGSPLEYAILGAGLAPLQLEMEPSSNEKRRDAMFCLFEGAENG
jgi:hypothetical protein